MKPAKAGIECIKHSPKCIAKASFLCNGDRKPLYGTEYIKCIFDKFNKCINEVGPTGPKGPAGPK